MIQIDEKWAIGADKYQWILYKRRMDAENAARLRSEGTTRIKEFEPTYYYPHLKDALFRVMRLSGVSADFESFTELEERFENKFDEVVRNMNLHREGMEELAAKRYKNSRRR